MGGTMSSDYYSNEFQKIKGTFDEGWYAPVREQAIINWQKRGFPQPKDEAWQNLRLTDLSQQTFSVVPDKQAELPDLSAYYLGEPDLVARIIVVNGFIHSVEGINTNDLQVLSFADALREKAAILQSKLSLQGQGDDPFFELNTALNQGGIYLQVNKTSQISNPVHLIHYVTDEFVLQNLRHFIYVEEGASLQLIETYAGPNHKYWLNDVSEIYLEAHSHLRHVIIQQEGLSAVHTSSILVHQDEACHYDTFLANFGADLARHQVNVTLNKQRSTTSIKGFSWLNDSRQTDQNIRIDHVSGFCESQTVFKSVMDDAAKGIFRGLVVVHPNAHKTVAHQSSKNVLLSKQAEADPKPQLEIYHDDVKCSHGSTVGQLDETALFYLKSRGLSEIQAKHLLTRAFITELVEAQGNELVRSYLSKTLDALMPDTVIEGSL